MFIESKIDRSRGCACSFKLKILVKKIGKLSLSSSRYGMVDENHVESYRRYKTDPG